MPIDASIPLQAKTPHFMGPQDVITLQNLAAQSQMNQLKLMQANEARQSMDALRTFYSDRNNFDEKGYVKPDRMNAMMALNPLVGEKIMDSESTRRMREAQLSTQSRLLEEANRKAREAESQRVSLAGLSAEMAKPTEEQALSAMGLRRAPPGSPHEFEMVNPQAYKQSEQTPFNIGYQSPERMEQLRLGAIPLSQMGTYLRSNQQQRVVGPGAGLYDSSGNLIAQRPFAPRAPEPLVPTPAPSGKGTVYTPRGEAAGMPVPEPQIKPPPGYRFKAGTNNELEAIPGGPADLKAQGQYNADRATLDDTTAALDRLSRQVKLVESSNLGRITGITGALPNVPGSAGSDAEARLNALKFQVGMSVLQAMRNASRTNASGLGQITEREHVILQNQLGNLEKAQSEPELRRVLSDIARFSEDAKTRIQNAYNIKHGSKGGGTVGPQPGDVEDGWRFRGGDPSKPENWEKSGG